MTLAFQGYAIATTAASSSAAAWRRSHSVSCPICSSSLGSSTNSRDEARFACFGCREHLG